MALEDKGAQHDKVIVDKYHDPVDDYTMTTRDYVVRPNAVDADAAITITLPPVAEAKGRFYSIIVQDATVALSVTIEDNNNDSESWQTDLVFNEGGRGELFYSDGSKWVLRSHGDIHHTSSLIAGAVNLREIHLTMDTAGLATVDASIVRLTSPVALGNSAGALFAQIDFDITADTGSVGGLAYAIGAEMRLPNNAAIPSGHYCCIDFEMGMGAATNWPPGAKVSYMRFDDWGAPANFAASAFFFTLAGARAAGNMISAHAHTIKMQFETDALKTRYLVCSEVENTLVLGNALDWPLVTGVPLVKICGNIDTTAASGEFLLNRSFIDILAGVDMSGNTPIAVKHNKLMIRGTGTDFSTTTTCAVNVNLYWTDNNAITIASGTHCCIMAGMEVGSSYVLTGDSYCGLYIVGLDDPASTLPDHLHSGIHISILNDDPTAANQIGSAVRIDTKACKYFLNLTTGGQMVSATGAAFGMTVDTVKIQCLIDGALYYLLATTTPA